MRERLGLVLSRSSCRNYRHRLGFVLKRPKKQLVKADPVRREAFVGEYAALTAAARRTGTKIFFVDEAHFRADADLRGKWVLKGEPALVDSTSPRRGEKASYYSAVCLETGEVEVMELAGNSNATTSTAFLRQLRARHNEPLTVIWDNSPAHRGAALRAYLTTPGWNLYLVNLYLVNLYLVFSQIRIGVYEVMWSSIPTLTGKQRCGRCRIHGSGEIQGTVDIGGAGTAAAIDPKRPAFRSGNHSGAHLAPD